MGNSFEMLMLVIASLGIIIIPILLLLVLLPWIVNSIFAYKLAKEAGYDHPGLAFVPLGSMQLMVVCNSLGGISGAGPSAKLINIMTILSCLFVTGFIPVVGWILAIVSFIISIVMIIFTIIHVFSFSSYNDRNGFVPFICWVLIPLFGFSVMCHLLKKQL